MTSPTELWRLNSKRVELSGNTMMSLNTCGMNFKAPDRRDNTSLPTSGIVLVVQKSADG